MDTKSNVDEIQDVVIRFSGDSGDGMQLTGSLFSDTAVFSGNDIVTFPDYPAEIRAPQGTVGGVSGFQVHVGSSKVLTAGDFADVLVAMNPAALKANAKWVKSGGTIIFDKTSFTEKNLQKAGYIKDPIKEDKLEDFKIIEAPISEFTKNTLENSDLDNKSILRCKNMFALGIVCWLYNKKLDVAEEFLQNKFKKKPQIVDANKRVLEAGLNYAETIQAVERHIIAPAKIEKGTYRNINGNLATSWGFLAASEKSNLELFIGSYPITPATDILQDLALRKDLGVKSFQAEDELAAVCSTIGASFAGDLAITSTSGPGLALKTEGIGLAVMSELPIVIIDVQRGGPSTGLPTKTEQADLFQALYGRNGESPVVVIAASTPSNCFNFAFEASKIALEHMTPVILLTDGYLAHGTEPWKIPSMKDFPEIHPPIAKEGEEYIPYKRDEKTLVRKWAIPGTKGLEHTLGGLEKDETGSISYDPENHEVMCKLREEKVKRVENYIPELKIEGNKDADILLVGWGGTYGQLATATNEINKEGKKVALAHFNYINPLPKNTAEVLSKFKKIIVCELNMGQFVNYLRIKFPEFKYDQYNKIQGLPFTVVELKDNVYKILEDK
ncbi:MAG: 2-oxoacid:acceptor oxidoreductase subunit alpha [Bacteroidetes bacterium]|nr:2-oxoacid:acceptor oxidoreductase subunit alpha [Bacteroidota bacterium]